jgi:hypothetical protein
VFEALIPEYRTQHGSHQISCHHSCAGPVLLGDCEQLVSYPQAATSFTDFAHEKQAQS